MKIYRVFVCAALLLLPWQSGAAPEQDPPVTKVDVDLNFHPALKTLSVKIGALFTGRLLEDDPYCRAAAILVAQQAVDNYGYWDTFIDLLKQTARGIEDGASYGGAKGVAKVARLAGAIIDAFDTDDPYGALGQLLIDETTDWVSGQFDAGQLDDTKKDLAEKLKSKLINAFFPGTPKRAKTHETKVGNCTVYVTPEFEWMSPTHKGGLTVFIDGDCFCKKPLELTSIKTIQNPHLQTVKDSALGRFKVIVFFPLTKLDSSVSFSGKPVDLTKLFSAAAKLKKAIQGGDEEGAKKAGEDLKKLVGKATKLDASLKLTPIFGDAQLKELYAKCGSCPEGETFTMPEPGTTEEPAPPTTDYQDVEKRCDPDGKLRDDISFWKLRRDNAKDPKLIDHFKQELQGSRDKLCPCLAKILTDPVYPAKARDEARAMYDLYCRDSASATPPPVEPPSIAPQPQPAASKACAEAQTLFEGAEARAKKYPSDYNRKQRDEYRKKLCDCIAGHPEAATEELKKLCPEAQAAPRPTKSMIIGVVLPSDSRPNDRITGSVVDNPRDYENVPGLTVVEETVQVALDEQQKPLLHEVFVDVGDGRAQPADTPITCKVPPDGNINISVGSGTSPKTPPKTAPTAPVTERPPATPQPVRPPVTEKPPSVPQTPPACTPGSVDVVEGPFAGDGHPDVHVGEQQAPVIAESPRAIFFRVPPNCPVGENRVTVREGTKEIAFRVATVALEMSADRTNLLRGESTRFEVKVVGLGAIKEEQWRGGYSPLLLRPSMVPREFAGPNQPGRFVLIIENASPETVSILHSKNEKVTLSIERANVVNGEFVYRGTIQSKRSGSFDVRGTLIPLLSSVPESR